MFGYVLKFVFNGEFIIVIYYLMKEKIEEDKCCVVEWRICFFYMFK